MPDMEQKIGVEEAAQEISALASPDETELSEVAEATSAEEDAWLDANLEPDDEGDAPVEVAEEAAEAKAPVAEETQPEAEQVEQAPEADNQAELADAYTVLRRAGFEMSDLEGLTPNRVLAIAEKQSKIQSDLDRRFRETTATDAIDGPEDSAATPNTDAEASADSPLDFVKMASPLAEALALDEDGTNLLVDFQKQSMAPLLDTIRAQADVLHSTQMGLMDMQAAQAREQLGERFPQLADTEGPEYARVVERMRTLGRGGEYKNMVTLMEDAASIEFAQAARAEVSAAQQRISQLKANGQPVPAAGPAHSSSKPMTSDDIEDMVLDALDRGDTEALNKARRLASR